MAQDSTAARTNKFDSDVLQRVKHDESPVAYRPTPEAVSYEDATDIPVWRVRFDLVSDRQKRFGLDINGEVILGRSHELPSLVDLTDYGAAESGVSRQHLILRPTSANLFAIDMGSTNGTLRNGHLIGQHVPSRLVNGDSLTLGTLEFMVHIIERPSLHTAMLHSKSSLADAMAQIAKAVNSQLDPDEVLYQVAESAMLLTSAGETGIWLIDEQSGELFLEAERGIDDETVRRMRVPLEANALITQVVKSGETCSAHRQAGESQIKVKTNYLVESLIYVPIKMGGMVLGVLSAVHRQIGHKFLPKDELLLEAIADFAAIAIQNARLYQSTDRALRRRVHELAALNEIAHAVSSSLDLNEVYRVLKEQVNRYWPTNVVHLYLLNERTQTLTCYPDQEESGAIKWIPVGKGIIGRAASENNGILSNDVQAHPDYHDNFDKLDGELLMRSIVAAPLHVQHRVVGVLALYSSANNAFSKDDLQLLTAFANPLGTAVANARLFAESESQRSAIMATARTFSQPLLILDHQGDVLVSNQAADQLLERHMPQLIAGISSGVGRTSEICVDDHTFLCTADHLPGVGTIVIMQDVTYVEKLEQDRSDFMHMLSHDLKTPLASVLGWADMLRDDMPAEDRNQFADNLTDSANRMVDLIDRMLSTVTQADDLQLAKQPCDLEKIMSAVIKEVAGAALYKAITVDYVNMGEAYEIWADEMRLYHMALNLVDNAIKYSPRDTVVQVDLSFSEFVIAIQVRDQGPGIPETEMPHLFEKHFRGTQAKLHPGAGLGLSMVRAIAEAHEGQVSARNLPHGGAEFTIKLPGSLILPE